MSKEAHIIPNGVHETWIDEPVRQAYERLFSEAVLKYNEKQTRSDRQIKSYYTDVCKDSKKHPVYEMIIGIYGKSDDGSSICSSEQGKEIMRQFMDNWKQRNPNLELIGAYYHADEQGEPHLHLDYIPVAHGYSRGLETQTGLVKALSQQGFEKRGKATAQIQWEKRENDYLTSLCEAVGLEVDHPKTGLNHLATEEYKAQKRLDKLTERTERTQKRLDELEGRVMKQSEVNALKGKKSLTGALRGVSYEEFLSLIKTASKVKSVIKENNALKEQNRILTLERDEAVEQAQVRLSLRHLREKDKSAEQVNKNRLLSQAVGVPENATYDEVRHHLQQQGLISQQNKNKEL